jgi:hypothetical protein
LENPNKHN